MLFGYRIVPIGLVSLNRSIKFLEEPYQLKILYLRCIDLYVLCDQFNLGE